MIRFESPRVDVLLLEGVGQCLHHGSELPLAFCCCALDTDKASVFIGPCGIVAV